MIAFGVVIVMIIGTKK
ncbi:hypothetical protein MCI96_10195 [Enterocloster sp. OA11]|nr:hypothetical protein [Enterocloster sp. OA11]